MVSEFEWRIWLKEKRRIEEIREIISNAGSVLYELAQASNPDGLRNAMFESRELGGNYVDRDLLETMLVNLEENIKIRTAEYEEYLINYEA